MRAHTQAHTKFSLRSKAATAPWLRVRARSIHSSACAPVRVLVCAPRAGAAASIGSDAGLELIDGLKRFSQTRPSLFASRKADAAVGLPPKQWQHLSHSSPAADATPSASSQSSVSSERGAEEAIPTQPTDEWVPQASTGGEVAAILPVQAVSM